MNIGHHLVHINIGHHLVHINHPKATIVDRRQTSGVVNCPQISLELKLDARHLFVDGDFNAMSIDIQKIGFENAAIFEKMRFFLVLMFHPWVGLSTLYFFKVENAKY